MCWWCLLYINTNTRSTGTSKYCLHDQDQESLICNIADCYVRKPRMPLVEQGLLTLSSPPPFFSGVCVTQSLVFQCSVLCIVLLYFSSPRPVRGNLFLYQWEWFSTRDCSLDEVDSTISLEWTIKRHVDICICYI